MKKYNIDLDKINSVSELRKLNEEINTSFSEREKEINIEENGKNLSLKPFGYIKECFESISDQLFKTNEGKKLISKYIETIKESNNLKHLHSIYENIRLMSKNSDVDYFVNNIGNVTLHNQTMNEDIKKLGSVLCEAYVYLNNENLELPSENTNLYKSVGYVLTNELSHKNLGKYSTALSVIREDIEKRDHTLEFVSENNDIDTMAHNLINDFNKKYSDSLTENELSIIKTISESLSPEKTFNEYKENCKQKMCEKREEFSNEGNIEAVKKIDKMLEQISYKTYNIDTLMEDITNLSELTKIFEA